jgi:hypothetical protein
MTSFDRLRRESRESYDPHLGGIYVWQYKGEDDVICPNDLTKSHMTSFFQTLMALIQETGPVLYGPITIIYDL